MEWLFNKIENNERFSLDDFIEREGERFPLLYELKTTEQDAEWHMEGNVYIHTNMVLQEAFNLIDSDFYRLSLDDKVILILSAVFHDIAKPITTKIVDIEGRERVISPRHAEVGASYLQYRLDIGNPYIEKKVIDIVMHHHDVRKSVKGAPFETELFYITRNVSGKLLYLLEIADIKGRECPDQDMLLLEIDIFKLYAESNDCFWERSDFDQKLIDYFSLDGIIVDKESHTFIKTKYDLLNNIIEDPHVGVSKHYSVTNPSVGYIMVGLSGSGKTTVANKLSKEKGIDIICPDSLREGNKTIDRKTAYRKMLEEVKVALRNKQSFIVDATNIREDSRNKIQGLIEQYGGVSQIIFVDTNIKDCITNDSKRGLDKQVGKEVILKQRDNFQIIKEKLYHK
jgi:putative nucleotidyltransferase with HDIG domain